MEDAFRAVAEREQPEKSWKQSKRSWMLLHEATGNDCRSREEGSRAKYPNQARIKSG